MPSFTQLQGATVTVPRCISGTLTFGAGIWRSLLLRVCTIGCFSIRACWTRGLRTGGFPGQYHDLVKRHHPSGPIRTDTASAAASCGFLIGMVLSSITRAQIGTLSQPRNWGTTSLRVRLTASSMNSHVSLKASCRGSGSRVRWLTDAHCQ